MEQKEFITIKELAQETAKHTPSRLVMSLYLSRLRQALESASTASENELSMATAVHLGEALSAMEQVEAVWEEISK